MLSVRVVRPSVPALLLPSLNNFRQIKSGEFSLRFFVFFARPSHSPFLRPPLRQKPEPHVQRGTRIQPPVFPPRSGRHRVGIFRPARCHLSTLPPPLPHALPKPCGGNVCFRPLRCDFPARPVLLSSAPPLRRKSAPHVQRGTRIQPPVFPAALRQTPSRDLPSSPMSPIDSAHLAPCFA